MYHYIQGSSRKIGPEGMPLALFKDQIEFLSRKFNVIHPDLFQDYLNGKIDRIPEDACVITFDDGLKEHYEIALQILNDNNIKATFFISGMPFEENNILPVHKVHIARRTLSDRIFTEQFETILNDFDQETYILFKNIRYFNELGNIYRYDDEIMQKIKYFITYKIDRRLLEGVLNRILKLLNIDFIQYSSVFYLNAFELS